jgi:peptidoglycan hydrolase-like protein with peptidoglycan-binding domain
VDDIVFKKNSMMHFEVYPGLLGEGSEGSSVEQLQKALLNMAGYTSYEGFKADELFGPVTRSVVMKFQQSEGLAADGGAGPATCGRLFKLK